MLKLSLEEITLYIKHLLKLLEKGLKETKTLYTYPVADKNYQEATKDILGYKVEVCAPDKAIILDKTYEELESYLKSGNFGAVSGSVQPTQPQVSRVATPQAPASQKQQFTRRTCNMALFNLPNRSNKEEIIEKLKSKVLLKQYHKSSNNNSKINSLLGKYKDDYLLIIKENELKDFIDKCIENGIVAIDTETMGLDPIEDDIVGISIKTPNNKAVYIPLNHITLYSRQRINNQLSRYCKTLYTKVS